VSFLLRESEQCQAMERPLSRPETIWATSMQAFLHAKSGDRAAADRFSRAAAAEIAAAPTVTHYTLDAVARCAEVCVWLDGSGGSTGPRLRQALKGLAAVQRAFPVAEPRARLVEGYLYRVRGKVEKACRSFELSLASAKRLRMPYDEGRASLALAALGTQSSSSRQSVARLTELGADAPIAELL
jgi:hypothetical protein